MKSLSVKRYCVVSDPPLWWHRYIPVYLWSSEPVGIRVVYQPYQSVFVSKS